MDKVLCRQPQHHNQIDVDFNRRGEDIITKNQTLAYDIGLEDSPVGFIEGKKSQKVHVLEGKQVSAQIDPSLNINLSAVAN